MVTARILAACQSTIVALALILTVSSAQARGGGEGGWHGGDSHGGGSGWHGGWHGGGSGWHGGGWHGGGWGWRGGGWYGGGWGYGPGARFWFGVPPLYYAPPPAYYYPPPVYYPPPYPYGNVPGYYGYGGPPPYSGGYAYGMSMRVNPNNCGTPDAPKPCTR